MKTSTPTTRPSQALCFIALLIFNLLPGCQTELDQSRFTEEINYEQEKIAIMQVIENESKAFWNKDFEEYSMYWAQEEYIRTIGWWEAGGVTVVAGWKERSQRTKSHMDNSAEKNETATKVRRENINLRIFKDMAWMTFDQYGEDTGDPTMDMPGLSRETRILEKHGTEWKIVYVGWLLEG